MAQLGRDILRNIYSYDPSQSPANLGLSVEDLIYEIEDLGYNPLEFLSNKILEERNKIAQQRERERSPAKEVYNILKEFSRCDGIWGISSVDYSDGQPTTDAPETWSLTISLESDYCITKGTVQGLISALKPIGNARKLVRNPLRCHGAIDVYLDVPYSEAVKLYKDIIELDKKDHEQDINVEYVSIWQKDHTKPAS